MDDGSAHRYALLQRLAASSEPGAAQSAAELKRLYHDRQMDGLAQDVYSSAKGEGQPPAGWIRLSEHPALMAEYASKLGVDKDTLEDMLKPDASGFRAEIYLPDPGVLGTDYKPVVAFKGSSGLVLTSDGNLHDTTLEDFLANNFAQSIGMETDYYDRAMELAVLLKKNGVDVEYAGHSLSGGMASAASAVSGERATTFNAAGLHPSTAERFARQHLGVTVSTDPKPLVTAYQVQGELLNDGVQGNIDRMDVIERAELAGVLKEACDLLHRVPGMRDMLERQLEQGLPPRARETVREFVERVATGETRAMLAELPLAAGDVHVLAPKTRDARGQLVDRPPTMSMSEATVLAAPVLEAAAAASLGARVGERGGEVVAGLGRLENRALHLYGDGVQAIGGQMGQGLQGATFRHGALLQAGEHYAGAALAGARQAQAEVRARLDQAVGEARYVGAELDASLLRGIGRLLPQEGQAWMEAQAERLERAGDAARREGLAQAAVDRRGGRVEAEAIRGITDAAEAATARATLGYGSFQHDALVLVAERAADGLDAMGQRVQGASRHAPAVYAAAGATAALGVASVLELQPANYPRLASAARVIAQGREVGAEAFERHLMASTVTPSMDGRIAVEEQRARLLLQRSGPGRVPDAGQAVGERMGALPSVPEHLGDFRHPGHPAHRSYQATLGKVHGLEEGRGISHGPHSERVAAKLVDRMQEERFGGLGRIELRGEGPATQVVAFESRPSYFMPEREIRLDLEQATACPVEQASLDWSRRALPHLHQPTRPPLAGSTPAAVPEHDPRHPQHPEHGRYLAVRGQVGQAYARVGVVRSETQLEQATAAVMLGAERNHVDWSTPGRLFLPPDPRTGVIAPENGLVLQQRHPAMTLLTSVGAQDMQHAPEAAYRQLAQGRQQASPAAQAHDPQGPAPVLA